MKDNPEDLQYGGYVEPPSSIFDKPFLSLPKITALLEREPWETAREALRRPELEMTYGPWTWRKYLITDGDDAGPAGIREDQGCLVRLGEEFSMSVWRPMVPNGSTPAGFRLVLLTWGEYLDMNPEDIEDLMTRKYAPVVVERRGEADT